ncbi:MAG: AsmA-like C-terminal region-containing protein [Aquabacterium sp.]
MSTLPEPLPEPQIKLPASARRRLGASAMRLGRAGRRLLVAFGVLTLTAALMGAMAWAVLLLQILPRIDAWRFDLAEQATRSLGVPVRIGKVVGRAEGIWPILSLREVQLLDAAGRVALRLPEVTASVSISTLAPHALIAGELRLDRLVLVAPELDVRRDRQGYFHVAGLKLVSASERDGDAGHAAADWVLTQARISISKGTVRWTDELMGAPTLALEQLDLTLRNRGGLFTRRHDLVVEATPPGGFGRRFALHGTMTQSIWDAQSMAADDGQSLSWWQRWELSTTEPSQWETWSGVVTAHLPHVDVQQLKRHVRLPIAVDGGRGALDAELKLLNGVLGELALDMTLQDVNVRLGRQLNPLAFKRLQGRLAFTHEAEESALQFERLGFTLADGLSWPASKGRLSWRHARWQPELADNVWELTKGGELQADRLDLALLAKIVDRLPVSPNVRATLADVAPHGIVEQLLWQWEGLPEAPVHYKASAQIRGLGWAPSAEGSRPGLDQAQVTVSADETGGRAIVAVGNGWVAFPGVFEDPRIPLQSFQARVGWTLQPGADAASRMQVNVTEAKFANADATGTLEASWRTGGQRGDRSDGKLAPRLPGILNLTGRLERAEANRVWRYLPLSIPKGPRDYVQHAIRSGQGENVTFEVVGDLDAFPFKDDVGGRFRVKVPMRNVSMDYVPQAILGPDAARNGLWPGFTSLEGWLLFEGHRMVIKDARGVIGGVGTGSFALRDVQGRIEDLSQEDPHLTISGQGAGPLNDMVGFLAQSPVGRWTGNVMAQAQSTGTGAMKLALDIPLDRADEAQVNGAVILAEHDKASLKLGPSVPTLNALQGTIAFTEKDLTVAARTRVWGHAMEVNGKRASDGITRFVAQGSMSAEGLRQAHEYPLLQRLAQRLSGETPVTVTVSMARPEAGGGGLQPEVLVSSTLQGMGAQWPAPLNKPAASTWPIKVVHRQEDAQGRSDSIVVDLGNPQALQMTPAAMPWLRVDLRRDTSGDEAKVSRGTISLIQAGMSGVAGVPALPTRGVTAMAALPSLDVDPWLAALKQFKAADDAPGPSSPASSAPASDAAESYVPESLNIRAGSLVFQQRTLKDVALTLAHPSPGVWRAQIESPQVAGLVEWLPESAPVAGGSAGSRMVARLSRLLIPPSEAQALEQRAAEQMLASDTAALPSLDIAVEQFEWRGLPLGRLEVEAINRMIPMPGAAPLPEWRMTKFRITTPEAQLSAAGNWTLLGAQSGAAGGGQGSNQFGGPLPNRGTTTALAKGLPGAAAPRARPRSAFGFTLDLQNSGALLTRLGLPQTIRGGKGKLTGQVSWLGSPMEPDPLSMAGDINVQISEGQFLKVDPGIAKLLGVLSLQSLPRRLTLDFRDLFQSGFVFDGIDGDVKIGQGVATTRNLRMRGLQAVVLIEGQADLAKETQNLHVFVVPEINAGGASLAYAAINPVIGLGTFLAQALLRKQIADAGTQEFRITGPWADPQVDKVSGAGAAASAPEAQPVAPVATKPKKPS